MGKMSVEEAQSMKNQATDYNEKVSNFKSSVENVMTKISEIDGCMNDMISKIDSSWDTKGAEEGIAALNAGRSKVKTAVDKLKSAVDSISNSKIDISW